LFVPPPFEWIQPQRQFLVRREQLPQSAKVRGIIRWTSMAWSLLSTGESIAIPCSVKASGLVPPRLRREGITFWESSASTSSPRQFKKEVRRKALRIAAHLMAEGDAPDLPGGQFQRKIGHFGLETV
jgi:hypothetical protein